MGDVTDLSNFMGAVIDDRAFAKHKAAIARAQRPTRPRRCSPAARSTTPRATSSGRPSWSRTDPTDEIFTTEYFGPILAVHVYDDADFDAMLAPDGVVRAVRPDRLGHRPGPRGDRLGAATSCASRPATSTSTTSRPARSSGSSRSAAAGPRGTNDKAGAAAEPAALDLAPLDQGDASSRRRTTATPTWAEPAILGCRGRIAVPRAPRSCAIGYLAGPGRPVSARSDT